MIKDIAVFRPKIKLEFRTYALIILLKKGIRMA